MEQTAALLGSAAIKTRLAGVTELLELLRRSDGEDGGEAALIPHVLPCLRDHNAKITQSALEICELLVQRTPEATVRSYFKLLWAGVVERLGDSKLPVRQKAVDVALALAETLDVDTILEKLKLCTAHKNWRTREQALYALWRCLEAYDLVISRKSEALDDALRLLEDPSKEVREAAIQTLEKFYAYVGPALVRELEAKNIRTAHMKMLSDRFQSVSVRSSGPQNAYDSAKVFTSDTSGQAGAQKDALTSILSSYDLQVDSSSSMARYLASVRSRTMNEAKSAAAEVERSPSQSSTTSNTSVADRSSGTLGDSSGSVSISDKDVQKQIATIYEQLEIKNDWTKRVEGLKAIQSLALQCASKDPTPALTALSVGVRTVRERLGEHVNDLRSSVSREACHTIHVIASVLRDDFSQHAEFFMGSLLKATYVTIQVISTSADKSIRGVINCTTNGYARIIPKFMDGARSRNQVLKTNCVSYLTLTLEQWSTTFLSKHTDVFVPNLPALLQDAVAEVRAQARKCYWAFHHLFPAEANGIFNRLDASTQRNLREDPARVGSESARKLRQSASDTAPVVERSTGASIRSRFTKGVRYALAESSETTTAPTTAQRVLQTSGSESAKSSVSSFGPRRVLGPTGSGSTDDPMDGRSTRMLSQGPRRIEREMRAKTSEDGPDPAKRTGLGAGPLRVLSTPKASVSKALADNTFSNLPDVPKPQRIHVGDPKKLQSETNDGPPSDRPRRLVRAASGSSFDEASPSNQPRSAGTDGTAGSVVSKVTPASFSGRQSSKHFHDRVEDSLLNLEHSSWSIRAEAVESIGKFIMMQLQNAKKAGKASTSDTNVDERILSAFVKHMNDAHYRVSQTVLGYFLPLIQLSIAHPQQLLPHLRSILSTLFQRVIETKENVRSLARENLDFIAAEMDASTLASFVVPLLNEGSNMKVKVAVCKYLQALLPRAEGYMKQGTNNNHMRSFLLKLAQLLDGEVPVSVSSACSDLIGVAVQEFAPEMESVMPMLPPSKRAILGKLLKSRGINLSLVTGVTRPGSANNLNTSKQRGADNQKPEELVSEDRQGERGRKRESPTANSSSPAQQLQKRPNTAESSVPANPWHDDRSLGLTAPSQRSPEVVINVALRALEQNNVDDSEHRRVLRRLLDVILHRFDAFSDELFERTFMGLLEATCDNDFYALRVLQQLVASGAARVEPFLDILVDRLLVTFGKHLDMSLHLVETTLTDALSASSDCQRALNLLVPFISSLEWPGLLVVLGLVRARITACAHRPDQLRAFLQQRLQRENLFGSLASLLRHQAMDVRKAAVQCLVALYFATEHDKEAMLSKYLDTELDDTRKKLVAIYIDRAKRERHHLTS